MVNSKLTLSRMIEFAIYAYMFAFIVLPGGSGTTPVKITRVILMALLLLYVFYDKKIRLPFYVMAYVLFLLYNVIMIDFADYKSYAVDHTLSILYVIAINVFLYQYLTKHNIIRRILICFIIFSFLSATYVFARYGLLVFMNSRKTDFGSANLLGFYCAVSFTLSFVFCGKYKGLKKYFFVMMAIMSLIFVILSASRKAVIYFSIPIVITYILKSKNPILMLRNIVIGLSILFVIYQAIMRISFLYDIVGSRIETMINGFFGEDSDSSTETRLGLIEAGVQWFKEKPVFGHGLHNFKPINMARRDSIFYAHNNYIEMLVDCGIVGTIIYYIPYLIILKDCAVRLKTKQTDVAVIFGLMISFLIGEYGMVTYDLAIYHLLILLFYILTKQQSVMSKNDRSGV